MRPSGKIKRFISGGDLAGFALSLLLAFGTWMAHNLSLYYSSLISMPVIAESNIDGRSLESSNTTSIVARCRTTGYNLLSKNRSANRKQIHVYFSPEDLHHESGDVFTISSNELGGYVKEIFGDDVQLESFVSSTVQFRFPVENHKKVPVQAISVISYKSQYTSTGSLMMSPDSVTVYGEPARIESIDRVYTETVNLQNLSSGAHGVARLETPNGVRLSTDEASYSLDVTRYVEMRAERAVSVRNVPPGKSLSVYPSVAEVVLRCSFPLGYDPTEGIRLFIDYQDFQNSIGGRCLPKIEGLSSAVIDYSVEPQVFECFEK